MLVAMSDSLRHERDVWQIQCNILSDLSVIVVCRLAVTAVCSTYSTKQNLRYTVLKTVF
jgi:hypothetical protein